MVQKIKINNLDFEEWYENEFMCSSSPRSPRYYQMRRAWLASKEFYNKEGCIIEMDLYRELCNKYGKGFVWSKNPDEICELIEELLTEKGISFA